MKLINWIKRFFYKKPEPVATKELTTEMLYTQINDLSEYVSSYVYPLIPDESDVNIYFTIKGKGNGLQKLIVHFANFKKEIENTPLEVVDSIFDAFDTYYKKSELQSYNASMYVKLEVYNKNADGLSLDYNKEWHPTQHTEVAHSNNSYYGNFNGNNINSSSINISK